MRETPWAGAEHERLWPFPHFPEAGAARRASRDLALRPFGIYESDLAVDFDRMPRPALVTHVLECCTRSADNERVEQSLFWDLPVGKRIECLVTLLMSGTASEIPLAFQCPSATCGEQSEIAISIEEVAALQEAGYATDRIAVPVGRDTLALRRPTGSDQLRWLERTFTGSGEARRAMVNTLLLNDNEDVDVRGEILRDEWLDSIDEAMDEHDPLVDFKLEVKCPSCDTTTLVAFDLEEFALRGLRHAQQRLLTSVHRLASHYHWSEQEIFAVPDWRRARYLTLIAKEKTQ